ncbi:hypothetical protein ETB97_007512 [Aspergillus alliaceus]|uniref:Uncharacterized protein n=1 Tax=Petromyces alliaceus TaxID=209559 RepID=A0A8H5ZT48_PETAA|nr:hypothetical protein ETB97_007512 [Aspergillus burnettii]
MKADEDVPKELSAHVEHAADSTATTKEALQASTYEHEATVWEALKYNYKAVLWSAAISLTIIMEGYDVDEQSLIYQFFTYPAFQRKFGAYRPEQGEYVVTGSWQAGLSNGGNVGIIIGGFLNGYLSTRFEYKRWIWPVPLFVLIMLAPESLWWLTRNNRIDDAYKSLARLDTRGCESHQRTLAQITHTLELEAKLDSGSSYLDCFRGIDRRRTEIVYMSFAGQVLSGSAFAYTPTYFFVQAGISTENAYQISIGGTAISFVGTITSWFLLADLGKTAYVWTATAAVTTTWAFFRLPECRGRTYDELDVMFHQKVPARKFVTYQINVHDADALKTEGAVDKDNTK